MRTRSARSLIALLLAVVWALGGTLAGRAAEHAGANEAARFFHDDLAPYGRWIDDPIYGIAWVPDSGQPDWHPYWDGRWVWTTEYGWYWHSREPYGWATYHYGRWVLTSGHGWIWVPGDEWGPAFVEWRYGDGYAGWAPMPSQGKVREGRQTSGGTVEARAWVFVPAADVARGSNGMRLASQDGLAKLLAGTHTTSGADLARELQPRPERIGKAASAAEQAAASDKGAVTVYRPPLLAAPRLDAAAAGGLDLNVPVNSATEIDPDAVAKARAKLDADVPPPRATSGSIETSAGGTFGSDAASRPPTASSSGGLGVGVPGVGGLRIGR